MEGSGITVFPVWVGVAIWRSGLTRATSRVPYIIETQTSVSRTCVTLGPGEILIDNVIVTTVRACQSARSVVVAA